MALQKPGLAEPVLSDWKDGKKSHGELRKVLEREVWPRYDAGLWSKPWPEFYANLARAVQPYAHYTPELQGWQFSTVKYDGEANRMKLKKWFTCRVGPNNSDDIVLYVLIRFVT